jgi:hypothetical protein
LTEEEEEEEEGGGGDDDACIPLISTWKFSSSVASSTRTVGG